MPGRDTAQLLLEVDARIATAQRAINQLARSIQNDSSNMERSLDGVAKAHDRVGRTMVASNGRILSGMGQLSFQIGDVTQQMSMGVKASTIFAQQSGHVIQALQVMGGEGNKFLQFLGGPWGIAISTATVILASMVPKLLENKDSVGALVEKMREQAKQAALNEQADKAWKNTIEGLTLALRKRREEAEKARKSDVYEEQQSLKEAERNQTRLEQETKRKAQELDAATSERAGLRREVENPLLSPQGLASAQGALAAAEKRVKQLAAELKGLMQGVRDAEAELRGAQGSIAQRQAENAVDPAKKAAEDIQFQLDALQTRYDKGTVGLAAYRTEWQRLTKALKDAREQTKSIDGDLTNFMRPVEGGSIRGRFGERRGNRNHGGIDIAVPVGTPVRAPAAGTIIESGVVGAYGNVIYIDHGRGTISRLAHLSQLGAKKGDVVEAGQVVGLSGGAKGAPGSGNSQGPHLHQEVRVNGRPVDPRKGSFPTDPSKAGSGAIRSAESELEREERRRNDFEERLDRLNQELLRSKAALLQGTDAEAAFAVQMVQLEQQRLDSAVQNDVAEKKLTQAEADQLKAKHAQVASERIKAIELGRQVAALRKASDAEQRSFEYRIEDMRFADEMASTQAEHRRLQLDILDIVYQQKEARLRALKAELELAGKMEEAARVQQEIDRLPVEQDRDRERTARGTMNPIEAWASQIPQSAAEITEALQQIQVEGLDSLANAITDVITGTRSLGEAFEDVARQIIADIIQMTVRMLIFRAVSAAIGGFNGGTAPGNDIMVTGLSSNPASVFGIDGARATGGPVRAGGLYLVGERGPELFKPHSSGTIIPKVPKIPAMSAANSNAPQQVVVHVNASEEFDVRVERVSGQAVRAAAPGLVRTAHDSVFSSLNRRRLPG